MGQFDELNDIEDISSRHISRTRPNTVTSRVATHTGKRDSYVKGRQAIPQEMTPGSIGTFMQRRTVLKKIVYY